MEKPTVCGVTNDGKLWFLGESEWLDVKALGAGDPGLFVSIGSADAFNEADPFNETSGDLHICGVTQDGRLWHTVGYMDKWEPFEGVNSRVEDDWGTFKDIGVANVDGELHVCVTAPTQLAGWRILHTIRHGDGTQDSFQDVTDPGLAGFPGSFISVACAELNKELHVCGVTDDGKLWHTVRSSQNDWLPFEEVQTTFANDPVPFTGVSIAAEDDTLEIFAKAGGDLWHTARFLQPPAWQPVFDSLKAQAGDDPGSFVSVSCAAAGDNDAQLHVYGATGDGKLWNTFRFLDLPLWFSFEDVTAEIASPGFFISVSAANIPISFVEAKSTRCQTFRDQLNQACSELKRPAITSLRRDSLKGKIQQLLQHWPENCNQPDVSPDCLS